ncbi:MAG: alpha/beta hydrolase, partial [Clostridia bacterium]|nr:alpha/beta hydrolase [Clostridia bacterium]
MSKAGVLAFRYLFQVGDWARLRKLEQDTSDLELNLDIPYLDDGNKGHLLDVYKAKDAKLGNPVVINIHGGGLFASFKDLNANFNYEFARRGFDVVSLSYIRLPDTTFWHQIDDCMNGLRYVATHAKELGLDLSNVYLTGDSAGALLAYTCCAIENSEELQESFDIAAAGLNIKALGLVSIMIDTTRHDLMAAITDQ